MKPPIIFARCYHRLPVVWIHGIGEKRGSSAHAQIVGNRAYVETCKINGLDFLTAIAPVLEVESIDREDEDM